MTRRRPLTPLRGRPMSRRQVVRAGLAGLATGIGSTALTSCSWLADERRPSPPRRRANEDQPLLESARADKAALLRLCVDSRDAHPGLARVLAPIIDHHRVHVETLGGEPGDPTSGSTPHPVPAARGAALSVLVEAEETASASRVRDSVAAVSGDFARVLGSIAASCSQHTVMLRAARPQDAGNA